MALSFWLRRRYSMFAWTAGIAVIAFRFETLCFLGLFVVADMIHSRYKAVVQVVTSALPASVVLLGENE